LTLLDNDFFNLIHLVIAFFMSIIIHELGHAFFVKIFRGKVNGLGIGMFGETFYEFKRFYIKKDFYRGSIMWELPINIKDYQLILVYFGGPLFNLITGLVCWIFGNPEYKYYYDLIMNISFVMAFINLLPFYHSSSMKSDGRGILDVFKERKTA
jgi:hypothetical protein